MRPSFASIVFSRNSRFRNTVNSRFITSVTSRNSQNSNYKGHNLLETTCINKRYFADFRDVLERMKQKREGNDEEKQEKPIETPTEATSTTTTTTSTTDESCDTGKEKESDPVDQDANKSENEKEKSEPEGPSLGERFQEALQPQNILAAGKNSYFFLKDNIFQAYEDMTGDGRSNLKKKLYQAESFQAAKEKNRKKDGDDGDDGDDDEEMKEDKSKGSNALVFVKNPKSAWQAMKERLQDSPFIREMLKNSRQAGQAAANTDIGKKATEINQNIKDKVEDAREFWETSQNPLVYTVSGVWENLTSETEEALAINEFRKLDPDFNRELWAEEVRKELAPLVIKAHLSGNTKALKPWLGDGVYQKLAAEIRARKHDGIEFDSNILDIEENQQIVRFLENRGAVIVVVYMVQQLNCIRNRKGEVIEGSEEEVRAKFYSMAFQQHYNEDDESIEWKVVDYEFAGDIPYY